MNLKLTRELKTDRFTLGRLDVDGVFLCWTLEDAVREVPPCENKVKAVTAIPKGTYTVILSFSNRFQKYMPEVLNVDCFAGIRIHSGNTAENSEGCILVGLEKSSGGEIYKSKLAFTALMNMLKKAEKKEKITIEIHE